MTPPIKVTCSLPRETNKMLRRPQKTPRKLTNYQKYVKSYASENHASENGYDVSDVYASEAYDSDAYASDASEAW